MEISQRNQQQNLQPDMPNGHAACPSTPKTFSGVDFFKFFFAICVIALHAEALASLPATMNYMITRLVFRVAVPYFFVASGFFLGTRLETVRKEDYAGVVRTYCFRLLKPLLVFELISLAYHGIKYLCSGMSLGTIAFLLGQSVVFYPMGALWYVQACIVGALLLYPFLKKDKLRLALILGIILYGFALIANNYSFLIVGTSFERWIRTYLAYCVSARNGLFTGFVTIALGVLCSRIYPMVCEKRMHIVLLALAGYALYIAEVFFIRAVNQAPFDDAALYITHLFFVPALFMHTLQMKMPGSKKLSVTLRNLSTGIYFLHRPILYLTEYFITVEWVNFLLVLSTAILICLFAYKTRIKPIETLLK